MIRRHATFAAVTGALAASFAFAPAAIAGNVAWNVSIGGPGFGVVVGAPGYWGGGFRGGPHRPWVRPVLPAPVVWPAPRFAPPFVVPAPVVFPIVAPMPVPFAAPVFVPRRVFVRAPVMSGPVVVVPFRRF